MACCRGRSTRSSSTPDGVAGVLHLGGTLLGTTNRDNPFAYPPADGHRIDRSAVVAAGYHEPGLDALIGVGGDGSLGILRRLAEQGGWNLVGIPKTIDNDVRHTEHPIGFNTAVASRPRRSTGCTSPRPATAGSWCSR